MNYSKYDNVTRAVKALLDSMKDHRAWYTWGVGSEKEATTVTDSTQLRWSNLQAAMRRKLHRKSDVFNYGDVVDSLYPSTSEFEPDLQWDLNLAVDVIRRDGITVTVAQV
ncbi:hypothetical protein M231_02363 [Tremella mesenterica]|uniref:Uncharacterized protein n=2 Tax=Tremella mesenterica TaxID=5217 RepID=A0A4Q1BR48_TREME|nr:hypothetical protein M231_02363 [Tremella mesenterica]